jgi:ribosomal protein S18 acetylase RimI-like enzyme
MPAEPGRLLEVLAATWPAAETRRLGPWTLRRGLGGGNRVSAATLDGAPADLDAAEAAMRAWGQRPLFMIRPGDGELDALLASRGYAARDPTLLFTAPVDGLAAPQGLAAIPCAAPLACMAETWAAGGVGPARLAVMARAAGPKTWLLGRVDDRPAGCGFVAIHDGTAMLHALEIAPAARRRGLGARMTRGAAAWAGARGAATLALAVTEANGAARALYAGLGMDAVGGYHYRIAPEDPA